MIENVQELTPMFNGIEPFSEIFITDINKNILETGRAIRTGEHILNPVNQQLLQSGLRYMRHIMPSFISQANKIHPDTELWKVIVFSFADHAKQIASMNKQEVTPWFKTLSNLLIDSNNPEKYTELTKDLNTDTYLDDNTINMISFFSTAGANQILLKEQTNSNEIDAIRLSEVDETKFLEYLNMFNDFIRIREEKELTPLQDSQFKSSLSSLENIIFKSAVSDSHIFVLDSSAVKEFINTYNLKPYLDMVMDTKVAKAHEMATSIFGDDLVSIKTMLRNDLITHNVYTPPVMPDLEF